jgi:hypothetical protein
MRDIQKLLADIPNGYHKIGDEVDTLANQMDPILFSCPVCGSTFYTPQEALACRDQPFDTGGLKVGDIVVVPGMARGHYDLDDPWLAFEILPDPDSDSHFSRAGYKVPYFVVTAVHSEHRSEHRCLVTLVSLVGGSLSVGWNPANGEGHHALYRIDGGKHCEANDYWIEKIEDLLDCKPSSDMLEEAARLSRVGISTRSLL